jgi:recombination protein RecT
MGNELAVTQNNQVTQNNHSLTTKSLFEREDVRKKFQELLGKRATSFITSVLQIAAQNQLLAKADPLSIYQAAAVAATLDLPLNSNLGFAYIVPYNDKQKGQVAQFQMGYKGFIQLAQRSGQFKSIYASPIYQGQIISENPLEGYEFDFTKKSDVLVGYAAKFKLINGYEATLYMTVDQLKKHGTMYSQTFKKGYGLWKDNFEAMASKTVLKLLLSKFAPLSVDMHKAVVADQAIIKNADTDDVTYIDNEPVEVNKEEERVHMMIDDCTTIQDLENLQMQLSTDELQEHWNLKHVTLANPQQ